MQVLVCGAHGDQRLSAQAARLQCMDGRTIADVFQSRLCNEDRQPSAPGETPSLLRLGGAYVPVTGNLLAEYFFFLWTLYLDERPELATFVRQHQRFRSVDDGAGGWLYRPADAYPFPGRAVCAASAIAAYCGDRAVQPPFDTLFEGIMRPRLPLRSIYTVGYTASTPEHLRHLVMLHDAVLVDVRLSPRSRNSRLSGTELRSSIGSERYVHLRDLGNLNYAKTGAPIRLAAPHRAIPVLRTILQYRAAMFCCACVDPDACHRTLAADYVSTALGGVEIIHLDARVQQPVMRNLRLPFAVED